MKKSLFSLLILSTLALSTQAIAQQIHLGGYNIDIQGRVIDEKLTCVVQD
ncbi:fimbrial protein, partial [Proteus mirabilis]